MHAECPRDYNAVKSWGEINKRYWRKTRKNEIEKRLLARICRNTSQQKIIPSQLTKNKFLMREITLSQQLNKSILNNDLI
jgi:hypothetical protein